MFNNEDIEKAIAEGKLVKASAPTHPTAYPPPPTYPAEINQNFVGPLPAGSWQSPDQQRQWQNASLPQVRVSPLPPSASLQAGAAAQSQALASPSSGGATDVSITLTAPIEINVAGSPADAHGEFDLTWAVEPSGTVFAAPINTVGGFDAAFSAAGRTIGTAGSIDIVGGQPSADPSWALYVGLSPTSGFGSYPAGWTVLAPSTSSTPQLAISIPSGATSLEVSQTTGVGNANFVASMLYFAGPMATFVQNASASSGGIGTPVSIPLASTGTGNALVVVCTATMFPASGAGSIQTGYTFTDTQSLTPYQVSHVLEDYGDGSAGVATQLDVFVLPNTVAGPETVNISVYIPFDPVFGYSTVAANFTIYEITTTTLLNGIPRFRQLPGVNLNSGVLGVLQPFYGGTGSNLQFTGGPNKVVMQEVTGAGFTVRQLAAADLSDGTVGTGAHVVLASTLTGTGTTGVLDTSPTLVTPTFTGATTLASAVMSGKITKYNNISTVSNGVPSELAQVNVTNATANLAATTVYAVPASGVGLYRMTYYVIVNRAATSSSTLPDIQLTWTDQDNSTLQTVSFVSASPTANTLTTMFSGTQVMSAKASTNVQYQLGANTAYASSGVTTMQYSVRLKVEAL